MSFVFVQIEVFALYDVSHIRDYILYLKNQCGLSVTLHPKGSETVITQSELMEFNIHDNSYCIFVKTFENAYKHCISCQKKVIDRCRSGSYSGICYAGVREFIYPITDHAGNTVGFISVSGYADQNADSYIEKTSERFSIPITRLFETYRTLKEGIPDKDTIDTLIIPLCNMLELAYMKTANEPKRDTSLTEQVIFYLKRYRAQKISSEDICSKFNCSRSHLSHTFNRDTGTTIREYLNALRINDAKNLLKNSKLTVTEIAYSVGFSDSNYFSNVFKRNVGMSPRAYRREE